jgi:hypothetical protein
MSVHQGDMIYKQAKRPIILRTIPYPDEEQKSLYKTLDGKTTMICKFLERNLFAEVDIDQNTTFEDLFIVLRDVVQNSRVWILEIYTMFGVICVKEKMQGYKESILGKLSSTLGGIRPVIIVKARSRYKGNSCVAKYFHDVDVNSKMNPCLRVYKTSNLERIATQCAEYVLSN